MSQVKVTGGFWQAKLETNRTVTIPHILEQNEKTGRVDNLRKGAGLMPGDYVGRRFNDTDIYKIVEAASYSLISHPDPALAKQLDALDRDHREGAAAGRLSVSGADDQSGEAGAGHRHRALAVREHREPRALQLRPHVRSGGRALSGDRRPRVCSTSRSRTRISCASTFGPDARKDAPGHEEVELALVKLYRATKDPRYLNLAKFFLDERGVHDNASLELHGAELAALQRSAVPPGRHAARRPAARAGARRARHVRLQRDDGHRGDAARIRRTTSPSIGSGRTSSRSACI